MTSPAIAGPHIVRYGTAADQKFLLGDLLDTYDQLVINATIAAHMPAALASFLAQRANDKPYFIDPQTHAFQHDFSDLESTSEGKEGEVKRSIGVLATAYGDPISDCINRKVSVLPEDFAEPAQRSDFCERVIRFQLEQIAGQAKRQDTAKYYEFLQARGMTGNPTEPSLVVAPYFYLQANTLQHWLPVNIKCALDSQKKASALGRRLGVQVVISQDVLMSQKLCGDVTKAYAKLDPDLFLIWVDRFSEHAASEDELRALVSFVEHLGKKAPVVNLYGGFFSVALRHCGVTPELAGITHGLEYGEDRGVLPIGGGIPVAKFYLPQLHVRLPFRDALRAIQRLDVSSTNEFFERVCGCEECRGTILKDVNDFMKYGETKAIQVNRRGRLAVVEFPLPETRARTVRHYMWSKAAEYGSGLSCKQIVEELRNTRQRLERTL